MTRHLASLTLLALLAVGQPARSQQATPQLEIFCGAELSYADVNYLRLYDVLVNLTPALKLHLGNDWQLAAQAHVPIVNDGYAERYDMLRLNMADVSKELHFTRARQHLKFSAGLFSRERYGADLRWYWPVTDWLMFNARLGMTSHWVLGTTLDGKRESQFDTDFTLTATGGASVWLNPWATELRATAGRYLNGQWGAEGEVIRHFRHVSASLFAQVHQQAPLHYAGRHHTSGGFRIVMMLPPYTSSHRRVVVRPASNFRLTYNAQSDGYSMKRYNTDPEENERTLPVHIGWGTGLFDERQ